MLSVTEAKLLVSGPSPLTTSLSADLTRLEVTFDCNISLTAIIVTKCFRNLMLSVTEAKLLVSGPSLLTASLSADLTRLEVIFDRNIAGTHQSCDKVFAKATTSMLKGMNHTSIF
jgi:hypothetical protein